MDTRATRSASAVQVLVADRHPIVRFGLRQLLQHESDFAVIGEAADGRETVRLANALQPDVLLLELATLQFSGLEAVRALTARGQSVRIIVMATSTEKLDVVGALQLGVRGVLWTHTALEFVARSIRRVMAGDYWIGRAVASDLTEVLHGLMTDTLDIHGRVKRFGLTARELEILAGVMAGESNKRIGLRLQVSEDTVKHHLTRMFDKFGVGSRLELALFVSRDEDGSLWCHTEMAPK